MIFFIKPLCSQLGACTLTSITGVWESDPETIMDWPFGSEIGLGGHVSIFFRTRYGKRRYRYINIVNLRWNYSGFACHLLFPQSAYLSPSHSACGSHTGVSECRLGQISRIIWQYWLQSQGCQIGREILPSLATLLTHPLPPPRSSTHFTILNPLQRKTCSPSNALATCCSDWLILKCLATLACTQI